MSTIEVQKVIGKYLCLAGHVPVIFNITYPGMMECDVFSITKSGYMSEYEVKVSRSDFKADFKKTTRGRGRFNLKHDALREGKVKSKKIINIPNYFSFACPEGLIKLEEVPEYAGLVYVTSDEEFKIIRKPKLLHTYKATENHFTKALRLFTEREMLGCAKLTYKNREIKKLNILRNKRYGKRR